MANILELKEKLAVSRANKKTWDEAHAVELDWLKKRIAELNDLWEQKNAELIENLRQSEMAEFNAETELREALIENYKHTGEKTFDGDLSVRVTTSLRYPTELALEWAKTNAPFLVQEVLDKKGFDPIAKAKKFPFVEIEEKVSAVISTKL